MKRLLFVGLFFLGTLFIPSTWASVESDMSALVDITEDIKNFLSQNIRDLLTTGNTNTGNIGTGVNTSNTLMTQNNTLLTEIKDIIIPFEGYLFGIRDYLRLIYEFITQERLGPNFTPEVRYYGFQNVEAREKEETDKIARKLDNLVQYGQYADKVDEKQNFVMLSRKAAMDRPDQYPQQAGQKDYYSTTSAKSIFDKDQYEEAPDAQKEAAIAFLQNVVGNLAVPVLKGEDLASDEAEDYVAYQRTMAAIQSVAARNIVEAYTSRFPVEYIAGNANVPREVKSKLQLLKEMNTFYPSSESYWSDTGVGRMGLAQKALAFFDLFFAFNFSLNQFAEQLEKINLQISLLITQATLLSSVIYGDRLYTSAKKQTVAVYPE